MKTHVFILLAIGLAGCVSSEERARRDAAALAQMNAEDDRYCQSYGVPKGSPGYVDCRNNLTQIRADGATVAAVNRAAASRAMMATGAAMMKNAQPQQVTVNCIGC